MRLTPAPTLYPKPNWPQRPKPARLKMINKKSIAGLCVLISLTTSAIFAKDFLYHFGEILSKSTLDWSARQGFALKYVLVEGRKNLSDVEFYKALSLYQNTPLLAIDLEAARQRLLQAPWVRDVTVTRILPDRLQIHIAEAAPFALWRRGEETEFTLIDEKGFPIAGVDRSLYPNLPIVVGEGAPENAATLLSTLQKDQELYLRIKQAIFISQRRWNVILDNGMEIKLPEIAPESAWAMLGQLAKDQKILDRAISKIDLRLQDKIFVEMPTSPLLQQGAKEGNSI